MVLGWLTVEEALEKILGYVDRLSVEEKPLLDSLGQVLAEDAVSEFSIPPRDNTAMDGYSVRWDDIRSASPDSPINLKGHRGAPRRQNRRQGRFGRRRHQDYDRRPPCPTAPTPLSPSKTPTNWTAIQKPGPGNISEIGIRKAWKIGSNIRRAGEDVVPGTVIIKAGTVLRPAEVGVLASLGKPTVKVYRKPVVSVLATGDELLEVGEPLAPGKIYNSNNYSVAGLVLRYGGIPKVLGIARDNMDSLQAKIAEGVDADMVITSAGVSKGDYDIVKDVLAQEGEIAFWMVKMKPARPLAFGLLKTRDTSGRMREVPHLGLPGNPVSSMIAFEQFGRPALLKMQGKKELAKPTVEAVMEDSIINTDARRIFARAVVTKRNGRYYARTTGPQGSGILTSMSLANGLAIVPEDVDSVSAGDLVQVQMLDWGV